MEKLQPGQVYQFDGMEYRIFRARANYDCFRCGKRIEKGEVYAR